MVTEQQVLPFPDLAPEPVAVACVPFISPAGVASLRTSIRRV